MASSLTYTLGQFVYTTSESRTEITIDGFYWEPGDYAQECFQKFEKDFLAKKSTCLVDKEQREISITSTGDKVTFLSSLFPIKATLTLPYSVCTEAMKEFFRYQRYVTLRLVAEETLSSSQIPAYNKVVAYPYSFDSTPVAIIEAMSSKNEC